ncbi:hypothetical protein LguiB_007952 [Lonicera macranthoides]
MAEDERVITSYWQRSFLTISVIINLDSWSVINEKQGITIILIRVRSTNSYSVWSNTFLCRKKNLCQLLHIFVKVLKLLFHFDANVFIEDTSDSLQFIVTTDEIEDEIRAHIIEIGVKKPLNEHSL